MSQGPIFPEKTDSDADNAPAPPVQIERSDDPNFGQTTKSNSGVPSTTQGNSASRAGCGASVFALLMLAGIAMLVAGQLLL